MNQLNFSPFFKKIFVLNIVQLNTSYSVHSQKWIIHNGTLIGYARYPVSVFIIISTYPVADPWTQCGSTWCTVGRGPLDLWLCVLVPL